MANKKTSKKKAPKTTAKTAQGTGVVFKKDAPDGALPPQAAGILSLVKAAGTIDRAELLKRMSGKIETRQTMATIFSFYRSKLVRGGFIAISA